MNHKTKKKKNVYLEKGLILESLHFFKKKKRTLKLMNF